jgi:hypothetical protein
MRRLPMRPDSAQRRVLRRARANRRCRAGGALARAMPAVSLRSVAQSKVLFGWQDYTMPNRAQAS